jgi:hypothetical protein
MTRLAPQRFAHRLLGIIDRALPVAGDAVVDPGVDPGRIELDRRRESLLGARRLAEREPRLAVGVMGPRVLRGAVAGFARGDAGGFGIPLRELLGRKLQEGVEVIRWLGWLAAIPRIRVAGLNRRFGHSWFTKRYELQDRYPVDRDRFRARQWNDNQSGSLPGWPGVRLDNFAYV